MTDAKDSILRALWRDKMHVEPGALDLVPAAIRATYEHIWQPAELVLAELQALPLGLLRFWLDISAGHLIFTYRPSGYHPGPQPWRDTTLEGVCDLSIIELREDRARAWRALLNLLDHLLGGAGTDGGAWLSDGDGATPALKRVAARLTRIHALGHWQGEFPVHNSREYLAYVWKLFLDDPRRLNTVDPLAHKLLSSTLMSERFWEDAGDATHDEPAAPDMQDASPSEGTQA